VLIVKKQLMFKFKMGYLHVTALLSTLILCPMSRVQKNHITNSTTGLRNVCTFPAKTRSKVANITTRGELGVMFFLSLDYDN
jgi:hypothetical protein